MGPVALKSTDAITVVGPPGKTDEKDKRENETICKGGESSESSLSPVPRDLVLGPRNTQVKIGTLKESVLRDLSLS